MICHMVDGLQNMDPYACGMTKVRSYTQGLAVPTDHLYFIPNLIPNDQKSKDTYGGVPIHSLALVQKSNIPGSPNAIILGQLGNMPTPDMGVGGGAPLSGPAVNSPTLNNNPANQPLDNYAKPEIVRKQRGGRTVREPQYNKQYVPADDFFKPFYRKTYDEIGRKFEEYKNIPTAETPSSSIMNPAMLSQLPGQIMSLASMFKGLSGSQKNKIKESVPPETYLMIEATFNTMTDETLSQEKSFTNRLESGTFANNAVDLLCQCTTYEDIIITKQILLTDPEIRGVNKLPEVEFKTQSVFGEVGIIVDGYGNARENVSPEVAAAQKAWTDEFVGTNYNYETTAQFYGHITNNVLTVSKMAFGEILLGANNILQGANVSPGSFVTTFVSGNTGQEGIYNVNIPSTTFPNTLITIITQAQQQQPAAGGGGGGGGGAGFPGMSGAQNFFGEASKLISEILPVLDPKGQQRVTQLIEKLKTSAPGAKGVLAGNQLTAKAVQYAFSKAGGFFS